MGFNDGCARETRRNLLLLLSVEIPFFLNKIAIARFKYVKRSWISVRFPEIPRVYFVARKDVRFARQKQKPNQKSL